MTSRVGQKQPNPWGLYDMYGNVGEWVQDWADDYSSSPETDPKGPESGERRVLRGGDLNMPSHDLRSAARFSSLPSGKGGNVGFRLARSWECPNFCV